MQPKIAYLIDENAGWDEDPSWKFYTEGDEPPWADGYTAIPSKVKRIVYWEIEEIGE
jgi:hypothetical protein